MSHDLDRERLALLEVDLARDRERLDALSTERRKIDHAIADVTWDIAKTRRAILDVERRLASPATPASLTEAPG